MPEIVIEYKAASALFAQPTYEVVESGGKPFGCRQMSDIERFLALATQNHPQWCVSMCIADRRSQWTG